MMQKRLYELTAGQLHELMKTREVSAVEVLDSVMGHIRDTEPDIRAYITLTDDEARSAAHAADEAYAAGTAGAFTGIPIAIKDNICTKDIRTTAGSTMLRGYVPPYDATVIRRLKSAGAVFVGKTNLDELAMGSTTRTSAFPATSNPWALDRVPGGSSGGSAATVAADGAAIALGSDTGGSVRQPAALCGVVGIKPTYGALSRYGLFALAPSLDHIGVLSKDVRDAASLLECIVGHDPKDSSSAETEHTDYTAALGSDIAGMKVGVVDEYFVEGVEPAVDAAVQKAIKVLEELGAKIERCSLPHTEYATATYLLICSAECSSGFARLDGVRFGVRESADDLEDMMIKSRSLAFGDEVKTRIILGTFALSAGKLDAYYGKALKTRTLVGRDFENAFEKYDVLLGPTAPMVAATKDAVEDNALARYAGDAGLIPANIAGLPAISVPCGFSNGLPVGLHLIAPKFQEKLLFRVAHAYETASGWRQFKPAL